MSTFPAAYLDGQSAGRRGATLSADQGDLLITLSADEPPLRWPLAEIRALRDLAGPAQMILRREEEGPERLVLNDTATIDFALRVCPLLDAQTRDPLGTRRLLIWSGAALASLLLAVFVIVPALAERLTPMVPEAAARALGKATRDQIAEFFSARDEAPFCVDPAGVAALKTMTDRLVQSHDLPFAPDVVVVRAAQVNALAMPGGHVVILSGLIEEADSAEEVAGVLAHELGHVSARDPLRLTLRSAGTAGLLSLALGDATGGTLVAGLSTQLLDAHYARDAEAAADAFAADMLIAAGVSPAALASFFTRLAETEGEHGALGYFASHPPSMIRADTAASMRGPAQQRPILSPQAWAALRRICDTGAAQAPSNLP